MKKVISIVMVIIFTLFSVGCSKTKQEIEKLSVVLAGGFDINEKGEYIYSAQILNVNKPASKTMSNKSSSNVVVFTSKGSTPYDAINHMSTSVGKNLFLGHSSYVVVGRRLAENGISLLLDTTLRVASTRPDQPLFVSKGTALDIIKTVSADEKIPANAIGNIVKFQRGKGYATITSRLDMANELSSKTAAPVTGIIDIEERKNADNVFRLAGTGVFKKDKLIGYMDKKETRGMQWIKGNVQSGSLIAYTPDNKEITFDILKSKSTVKPVIKNNKITMQINIKEQANITELTKDIDLIKNPEKIKYLNEIQNRAIKNEVQLALDAAQKKLRADVFDFGGNVHRHYPKLWKSTESKWQNIFPNLKVEVNVDSSIKRPGIISKPIK
ncbi:MULTISPECIES: Ger(x)C family spore germination protein [Clostridium]|uniref:Ger(x)C family spore germination protein n=1 Tax=Clostridium TaxID=1485 RepID=UPI0008267CA4|nr:MULTISPECIES: Ger(x)C family spore germination protein [Clostridium]PJI10430.1 Ger(x)C family spore germination protein [Clostridium sp. CT7]